MKTVAITLFCSLVLSLSNVVNAELLRIDEWGKGTSQFEAMKDAYKKILSKALKVSTGANLQDQIRRTLEAEVEEDIKKVEYSYFPNATADCNRNNLIIECFVVAPVQMDELAGWIRQQRAVTGKGGNRIDNISYALTAAASDDRTKDFMLWLHNKLEGDFGYDVFYSDTYVETNNIGENCEPYRKAIAENQSKSGFQKTLSLYKSSLKSCEEFVKRDVAIIVDNVEFSSGQYQTRDSNIEGFAKINLSFFDINSSRILPSPEPKTITQFGQGSPEGAKVELYNNLYEASSNYIAQKFNDTALNITPKKSNQTISNSSQHMLTIRGLNSDIKEDIDIVRFIRNWFKDEVGLKLQRDFERGDSADQVFTIESDKPIKLAPITEELRYAMAEAELSATIDIDRNANINMSFATTQEDLQNTISWNLTNSALKSGYFSKRIEVESTEMVINRRDQRTGIALSLLQAKIQIRNKYKRDFIIEIEPLWYDAQGVRQEPAFNDTKLLEVRSGTSDTLFFNPPSRYAQKVELLIGCRDQKCKKK